MIKFGTGGWRAVIGDEFTRANIQKLARALALKMKQEGNSGQGIAAGYDRRFLSREAAGWACGVLAEEGIRTWLVNQPAAAALVMFQVQRYRLPYGFMVTAGHNPEVYNGVKLFTAGGCEADSIQTSQLERYIDWVEEEEEPVRSMDFGQAVKQGLIVEINPLGEYLDSILALVDLEAIRRRRLRIVLDPMYGTCQTAFEALLLAARCEVRVSRAALREQRDVRSGKGQPPLPPQEKSGTDGWEEMLLPLKSAVLEFGGDMGIAADGDAGRLGVIDDRGRFLPADEILALLYRYLMTKKKHRGAAVRDVDTSHLLDQVAERFGERCYEVPVGFQYVSAKMRESGALIGGGSFGGVAVEGGILGKDVVLEAMLLAEMTAVTGKKLSELVDGLRREFGSRCRKARNYPCSPEKKKQLFHTLMEDKELPVLESPVEKVSYLDGSKVYFKDGGFILVRFSGTEPLLRISCERQTEEEAVRLLERYEKWLEL